MTTLPFNRRRVLAVASGGGHWIQLLRLKPAMQGHDVTYVSADPSGAADVAPNRFLTVPDANKDTRLRLITSALAMTLIVARVRPHVVITTGAAPGYLAVRVGGLFGAHTLFIDSVANAETLSLSASLAIGHADAVLSQWPGVAARSSTTYAGSLL